MMKRIFERIDRIPEGFSWFNEPRKYEFRDGLVIHTEHDTDFWQGTHYGFRRDNGHCLLTELEGDFTFSLSCSFRPNGIYDQCGMILRIDAGNWIKASTEYEDEEVSRLGSVVTVLGFSDWATTDISSDIQAMHYRISRRGQDCLLENSHDGSPWKQMRIAHLHRPAHSILVGPYACSPVSHGFSATFGTISIVENQWLQPS